MESGNDGAIREQHLSFPVGVDRYIVAKRRGDLRIRVSPGQGREDHKAVGCCGRYSQKWKSLHNDFSPAIRFG